MKSMKPMTAVYVSALSRRGANRTISFVISKQGSPFYAVGSFNKSLVQPLRPVVNQNRTFSAHASIRRSLNSRMASSSSRSFHASSVQMKRDFYEVLCVPRTATKEEIKKSYHVLVKKYHPDVNKDDKNAEEKFKEVAEAYEILGNEKSRKNYDNFGHAGVDPNMAGGFHANPFDGFSGFSGFQGGFQSSNINIEAEDIFEMFGMRAPRRTKGNDINVVLDVSFLEAVNGCEKEIKFDYVVRESNKRGKNAGSGTKKSRAVTLKVPAGVDTGVTMRVPGHGEDGPNGLPPGDLMVSINAAEDSYFRRKGMDIHVDIPVSITKAILGGTEEVLTLDGIVDLKIPPNSQPGASLLMRGKGVSSMHDSSRK